MTSAVDVVDGTGLVADHEAVRGLVEAVLGAEGLSGEVAVAFVDEAAIADLNSRYRQAEGPTDVLAFDYGAEVEWPGQPEVGGREGCDQATASSPGGAAIVAGEVVVCPQVVVRYAVEEGRDSAVQLGWTLIHGVLHLAGYDHETDEGQMRRREQELLERLNGLVRALSLVRRG